MRAARAGTAPSREPARWRQHLCLADALAAAGRAEEAAESLRAAAEQLVREGQCRKAVAALRRCERLRPAAEVRQRLAELQAIADADQAADRRRCASGTLHGPVRPFSSEARLPSFAMPRQPDAPAVTFELLERPDERYHARAILRRPPPPGSEACP